VPLRPVFTRYGNELNQASTRPLNCFQFPSIRFQSIAHSCRRKSQLAQKATQCNGRRDRGDIPTTSLRTAALPLLPASYCFPRNAFVDCFVPRQQLGANIPQTQ